MCTIADAAGTDATSDAHPWTMREGPIKDATFGANAVGIDAERSDVEGDRRTTDKGKLDYYAVASLQCRPTIGACTAVGTRAKENR